MIAVPTVAVAIPPAVIEPVVVSVAPAVANVVAPVLPTIPTITRPARPLGQWSRAFRSTAEVRSVGSIWAVTIARSVRTIRPVRPVSIAWSIWSITSTRAFGQVGSLGTAVSAAGSIRTFAAGKCCRTIATNSWARARCWPLPCPRTIRDRATNRCAGSNLAGIPRQIQKVAQVGTARAAAGSRSSRWTCDRSVAGDWAIRNVRPIAGARACTRAGPRNARPITRRRAVACTWSRNVWSRAGGRPRAGACRRS